MGVMAIPADARWNWHQDPRSLVSPWSLSDGGGQDHLAGRNRGQDLLFELVAAPAGYRERAGHHRGQGLHGDLWRATADLGEERGGVEDAEAAGPGYVEQAGLGQFFPWIGGRQDLRSQARHRSLGFAGREIHNEN